jgi:hypothetical protein
MSYIFFVSQQTWLILGVLKYAQSKLYPLCHTLIFTTLLEYLHPHQQHLPPLPSAETHAELYNDNLDICLRRLAFAEVCTSLLYEEVH